jgi:hypothetical protein
MTKPPADGPRGESWAVFASLLTCVQVPHLPAICLSSQPRSHGREYLAGHGMTIYEVKPESIYGYGRGSYCRGSPIDSTAPACSGTLEHIIVI